MFVGHRAEVRWACCRVAAAKCWVVATGGSLATGPSMIRVIKNAYASWDPPKRDFLLMSLRDNMTESENHVTTAGRGSG
jgi:hypothetical protein